MSKLVPKVNTDGLYLEDEVVDDAFSGVVPFYALGVVEGFSLRRNNYENI